MTNNEYKQFYDVYGIDVVIESLKKDFETVSYCAKSIPSYGSPCFSTKRVTRAKEDGKITGVICHRCGDLTIKTNYGNYRFSK